MNPYATAFSHLMNQYSSAAVPNGQGAASTQATQGGASAPAAGQLVHPAYQVYIPGAAQPAQYPHPQAYSYSYPAYPGYPMQSQYAASAMPAVYGVPMMYPQALPTHMPQAPLAQPQHAQMQSNRSGNNKNKHGHQNNKRPQPLQNSSSPTPTTAHLPTFPITPAATTAQPLTSSVVPPQSTQAPAQMTHFCEACDKEFPNQSTYNSHCSTHEQCSYPGCSFTASKRVVQAHFHSTHGLYSGQGFKDIEVEGQSFRVLLGTSPEEVAQWRAERRKKFPSAASAMNTSSSGGGGGGTGPEITSTGGPVTSSSTTMNQPPKKSQAALRREEWKQKKKQQQLERQHYKELRKAHHSRPSENDEGSTGDGDQPRNFIQIHSSTGPTKGIEVLSTTGTDEDPANVTSIRLATSNEPSSSSHNPNVAATSDGQPPTKRARFEKKQQQQQQNRKDQSSATSKRERGSVLRKPDISGNLLAKLLQKEIYAEECLILATIRYLRELYDPDYPPSAKATDPSTSQTSATATATATAVAAPSTIAEGGVTTTSTAAGATAVPPLAELLTKDIDELLAEVEAAEARGENDDENDDDDENDGENDMADEDDADEEEDDGDEDEHGDRDNDGDDPDGPLDYGNRSETRSRQETEQSAVTMDVDSKDEEEEDHRATATVQLQTSNSSSSSSGTGPGQSVAHALPGMDEYASEEDGEVREED